MAAAMEEVEEEEDRAAVEAMAAEETVVMEGPEVEAVVVDTMSTILVNSTLIVCPFEEKNPSSFGQYAHC